MSEIEYNEIFSKRLRYYLEQTGMTQAELAKRLGVGTTSVSNWVNGIKSPRVSKVDAMCKIFHCTRADFVTETPETNDGYYVNPETAQIAQAILDSKELSALFDVSRKISPEDVTTVYQMALALYRKEHEYD